MTDIAIKPKLDISKSYFKLFFRIRFKRPVTVIEESIVTGLSFIFFRGDIRTWTNNRCYAYRMYLEGSTTPEISAAMMLPCIIIKSWFMIWDAYEAAFNKDAINGD